jgi:hypothetical protein
VSENLYSWLPRELDDSARRVERRLRAHPFPTVETSGQAWATELGFDETALAVDHNRTREVLVSLAHSLYRATRNPSREIASELAAGIGISMTMMKDRARFSDRLRHIDGTDEAMLKWIVVAGLVAVALALVVQKRSRVKPQGAPPRPKQEPSPAAAPVGQTCLVLALRVSDDNSPGNIRDAAEARNVDDLAKKPIHAYWYGEKNSLPEEIIGALTRAADPPGEYDIMLVAFDLRTEVPKLSAPHATDRLDALESLRGDIQRSQVSRRLNISAAQSMKGW